MPSLRVLLIDAHSSRSATLRAALGEAGFHVVGVIPETDDLDTAVKCCQPDVVIVDTRSLAPERLEPLAVLERKYRKPLLLLFACDERRTLLAAAHAGVSAYVVEGFSPALLRSLVEEAVRQFSNVAALCQELSDMKLSMEGRRVINRAKCLLMEQQGMSEQAAYSFLRKSAMDRGLTLAALARNVLQHSAL